MKPTLRATKISTVCAMIVFAVAAFPFAGIAAQTACGKTGYECAEFYIQHGKFDLAEQSIQPVLAKSPRDARALTLLGAALAGQGRLDDSNRELVKALKLIPQYVPALRGLAVNEIHQKQTAEAKQHLGQVLKIRPSDPIANLWMGRITHSENQCKQADQYFLRAGKLLAQDAQALLDSADCSLQSGGLDAAKAQFQLLADDDSDSHLSAGKMLMRYKHYAEAAEEFGLAEKHAKNPYEAGFNQTLAYLRAEKYDAAIAKANELLNQGHETSELANAAGTAYQKSGKAREAYNAFRLATHLDPKSEDSYIGMCEINLDREDYDSGVEVANIGLSNLPKSDRLYAERGVLRAMKGQFDEAAQDFAEAQKLAPGSVLPSVALGLVAMQKGNLPKATQLLRECAHSHPNNYFAQYWLAVALIHSGAAPGSPEEKEVVAALEASVKANPDFWHSRSELGKILLRQGQVDRAIVELERATALNPESTAPIYLLAQAYRTKGETEKAKEQLARLSAIQKNEREDMSQGVLRRALQENSSTPAKEPGRP